MGCIDTIGESAQKVDPGRKIPCCTGELNLHQRHASPMLYQLSYIPTPYLETVWIYTCVCVCVCVCVRVCVLSIRLFTTWFPFMTKHLCPYGSKQSCINITDLAFYWLWEAVCITLEIQILHSRFGYTQVLWRAGSPGLTWSDVTSKLTIREWKYPIKNQGGGEGTPLKERRLEALVMFSIPQPLGQPHSVLEGCPSVCCILVWQHNFMTANALDF